VDLRSFLVAELARSFGFPFKNRSAESLGDFRYGLCPRDLSLKRQAERTGCNRSLNTRLSRQVFASKERDREAVANPR